MHSNIPVKYLSSNDSFLTSFISIISSNSVCISGRGAAGDRQCIVTAFIPCACRPTTLLFAVQDIGELSSSTYTHGEREREREREREGREGGRERYAVEVGKRLRLQIPCGEMSSSNKQLRIGR